jgi:hypothetical protein
MLEEARWTKIKKDLAAGAEQQKFLTATGFPDILLHLQIWGHFAVGLTEPHRNVIKHEDF